MLRIEGLSKRYRTGDLALKTSISMCLTAR